MALLFRAARWARQPPAKAERLLGTFISQCAWDITRCQSIMHLCGVKLYDTYTFLHSGIRLANVAARGILPSCVALARGASGCWKIGGASSLSGQLRLAATSVFRMPEVDMIDLLQQSSATAPSHLEERSRGRIFAIGGGFRRTRIAESSLAGQIVGTDNGQSPPQAPLRGVQYSLLTDQICVVFCNTIN